MGWAKTTGRWRHIGVGGGGGDNSTLVAGVLGFHCVKGTFMCCMVLVWDWEPDPWDGKEIDVPWEGIGLSGKHPPPVACHSFRHFEPSLQSPLHVSINLLVRYRSHVCMEPCHGHAWPFDLQSQAALL